MHRARFLVGLAAALGAILVTAGCGDQPEEQPAAGPGLTGGWSTAGCEFGRRAEHMPVAGLLMPATPAELSAAMDRVDRGGRTEFADSYAGIEVDQERVRAIVYRVPSAAFDQFIRRAAENACIVVRDADHSATDLAFWHDRVLADIQFWTHRGIRLVSIGARHDGTGIEIGTRDLDRARLELPARYGARAPLLFMEEGPIHPLPNPTATPHTN
ncbi:hypothetical protein [Paractinoplanes atraurantiacus]|uniref:Uncharacterized protein n=1 Tax=Paractinoplanes atraurantiacus TaxID=1036182 RepID=A0A285F2I0_9ACTN|nr:hypothetical protein [Actinoplanes atraurantiacus]SNY05520.1 hypothetical protein SAMN05421748_101486 [Actinoplanes atraurantiacus]